MGQKTHPIGIRLGINKDWTSTWYSEDSKIFSKQLNEDLTIREKLMKSLKSAAVSRIQIERSSNSTKITIHAARPGVIIGKKGEDVEKIKRIVAEDIDGPIRVAIQEVKKPELDAKLVAESVAQQLEKRVMFRRAMKRAVSSALKSGAEGIKINLGGRLGGAEIARSEWYREGRVPLHTFRADIDYGTAEALTTYGIIGIKVWIFKGEVYEDQPQETLSAV